MANINTLKYLVGGASAGCCRLSRRLSIGGILGSIGGIFGGSRLCSARAFGVRGRLISCRGTRGGSGLGRFRVIGFAYGFIICCFLERNKVMIERAHSWVMHERTHK